MKRPLRLFIEIGVVCCLLVLVAACSINVKKDESGQDKNVDIRTPIGSIHVDKGPDSADTGLSVYPGARPKPETDNGDEHRANVRIATAFGGVKVVALEYESDADPAKLVAYYKSELKHYGNVLECRSSKSISGAEEDADDSGDDKPLTCDSKDKDGANIELKVGTQRNQHIVSIKPNGKGSSFALVRVQVHGKETI